MTLTHNLSTRNAIVGEDERDRAERERQMALYARIVEKCGGSREKEALKILRERHAWCTCTGQIYE